MLEVKKELLDTLNGYDVTIINKENCLCINRENHHSLSIETKDQDKPFIITFGDNEIYMIFDELFNKIFNCNINNFKHFSYNEYIKFLKLYKQICKHNNDSIIITDNDTKLIIEKHMYFFKLIFLGNNKINLSKDNLSYLYTYFLELLNDLENVDNSTHQISINEYLVNNSIKQKVRRRI